MKSAESNKERVIAFYERVGGGGRYEQIPAYIAHSYVDHGAPADAPIGLQIVENHLRRPPNTFPDFELHVHEAIAEGECIAARVIAEGTYLGEWLGVQPSGKRIALRGINLDRVVDGLIVEHRDEADTVSISCRWAATRSVRGIDPNGVGVIGAVANHRLLRAWRYTT